MISLTEAGKAAPSDGARWRLQRLPTLSRRRRAIAHCVAIVFALALSGLVLSAMGLSPLTIGRKAILASVATEYGLVQAATLAVPLTLTGLAAGVALRIGVWNIGGD